MESKELKKTCKNLNNIKETHKKGEWEKSFKAKQFYNFTTVIIQTKKKCGNRFFFCVSPGGF